MNPFARRPAERFAGRRGQSECGLFRESAAGRGKPRARNFRHPPHPLSEDSAL
jgi:hypothetical protein